MNKELIIKFDLKRAMKNKIDDLYLKNYINEKEWTGWYSYVERLFKNEL